MINRVELFPSTFLNLQVDPNACRNILSEIEQQKDSMKIISNAIQQQSTSDYITDYGSPTKLEWFEKIWNQAVVEEFKEMGIKVSLVCYWTAIYNHNAIHLKHTHRSGYLDPTNYSGILYLSNIGKTTFYSPNHTSTISEHDYESSFANMVLFPSTIIHEVKPHANDGNERYVVSFNAVVE